MKSRPKRRTARRRVEGEMDQIGMGGLGGKSEEKDPLAEKSDAIGPSERRSENEITIFNP